jgi:hypothetical protein
MERMVCPFTPLKQHQRSHNYCVMSNCFLAGFPAKQFYLYFFSFGIIIIFHEFYNFERICFHAKLDELQYAVPFKF